MTATTRLCNLHSAAHDKVPATQITTTHPLLPAAALAACHPAAPHPATCHVGQAQALNTNWCEATVLQGQAGQARQPAACPPERRWPRPQRSQLLPRPQRSQLLPRPRRAPPRPRRSLVPPRPQMTCCCLSRRPHPHPRHRTARQARNVAGVVNPKFSNSGHKCTAARLSVGTGLQLAAVRRTEVPYSNSAQSDTNFSHVAR
jgi:hypothetical protein